MQETNLLPKPGRIGRGARFIAGAVALVLSVLTLLSWRGSIRVGAPEGAWWLLTAISIYNLNDAVNIGLGGSAGRRVQGIVLLLIIAAAAIDLPLFRNLWGPPLGGFLYALNGLVLGVLGFSFVLAGMAAVPGCEMRALPYLLASASKRDGETHY